MAGRAVGGLERCAQDIGFAGIGQHPDKGEGIVGKHEFGVARGTGMIEAGAICLDVTGLRDRHLFKGKLADGERGAGGVEQRADHVQAGPEAGRIRRALRSGVGWRLGAGASGQDGGRDSQHGHR